jgi:hypothetical protein
MEGPSAHSVRFFGGPLDGRVQDFGDTVPVTGTIVRHVHLHDGPKIETLYELSHRPESGWEYRVLTAAGEPDGIADEVTG